MVSAVAEEPGGACGTVITDTNQILRVGSQGGHRTTVGSVGTFRGQVPGKCPLAEGSL